MTDLDFLDEATPIADAVATPEASSTSGPDTSVSAPEGDTEADGSESKYTNVVATYEPGSEPEGLKTVSDFASELSIRNVLAAQASGKGATAADLVDKSAIYVAMRAVRNPLPVVLVGKTAMLPPEAVQAWDERPVRGEGTGPTGGTLSDEDLYKAADRARSSVSALEKRLASVSDRLSKAKKLQEKRSNQLTARNLTWDQVDEWAAANETEIADEGDNAE